MAILSLLPILLTLVGTYFLIKLRSLFLFHPLRLFRLSRDIAFQRKSRNALLLALAGTLGVGNMVGIAYGISVGGAGCVFWTLVSSVFAAVIKYAESSLASYYGHRGMTEVILRTFRRTGFFFSRVYAALCVALSLTMGSALQVKSAVFTLSSADKRSLVAILFFLLLSFVIVGGAKKIVRATSFIIPFSTIIYISLCLAVIFSGFSSLGTVFRAIITDAFNFKSAASGIGVFFASRAVKQGYLGGLLSNEAGAGTSAMAQSLADAPPGKVGLLGVVEVFFDTALLCSLTGVAILASGAPLSGSGINILLSSFSTVLGTVTAPVLLFLIFAFAFSTVICWYYYGSECVGLLFNNRGRGAYTVMFFLSSSLGIFISESRLISVSNYMLFLMTVITVFVLIKNSERIYVLSESILKNSDI